jgi:hypothetical protein
VYIRDIVYNPKNDIVDRPFGRYFRRDTGEEVEGLDLLMVHAFSEGLAVARRLPDGNAGYIDASGRTVIPFRFSFADSFQGGRARVEVSEKRGDGLIDRDGRWVVPPGRYEQLGPYGEGRCAFRVGELWGFLDALGNEVIPPTFRSKRRGGPRFHSGLAIIRDEEGNPAFIDRTGDIVLRVPGVAVVSAFRDGVARVILVVDDEGEPIDPQPESDPADVFGVLPLDEMRYGYISLSGRFIVSPKYPSAGMFSQGLAPVSMTAAGPYEEEIQYFTHGEPEGETWGYIDTTGKLVIDYQFEWAGNFREGLARVQQNGKWGYIDKSGEFVIPPRFEWAENFVDGVAEVWVDDVYCFIDRTGRIIVKTDVPVESF